MGNQGTRRILNFHFDYLNTSLMALWGFGAKFWSGWIGYALDYYNY